MSSARAFRLARSALDSLRASPLRTVLTTLGIVIGVSAVVQIMAFGEGCYRLIIRSFEAFGTNRMVVFPGARGAVRPGSIARTLALDDGDVIRAACPSVAGVSEMKLDFGTVVHEGRNWHTTLWGAGADFRKVRSWAVRSGGFFGAYEVNRALKVCVLGATPARELFGDADPVGRIVRVKNVPFRVVGVLARKGPSLWVTDQDDVVVIPYTTVMKKLSGSAYFSWIQVRASSETAIAAARREIRAALRERHALPPGEPDDFSVHTQNEMLQVLDRQKFMIVGVLLCVAALSLIAGGVGIMNIMLVSVMERTREIGLRRAVGAREVDVLLQFLAEALLIGLLGGALGVLAGIAGACALSAVTHWPIHLTAWPSMIAFTLAGLVGVGFGLLPAWRASRLDPIDALRR